jgi:hypothetical protein
LDEGSSVWEEVVIKSLAIEDMNTEIEGATALGAVTRQRLVNSRLRKLNVCCSELQSV